MKVTVVPDGAALAAAVADRIAALLDEAIAERSAASVAFSGGSTPALMLRELSSRALRWDAVTILQVDERIASDFDPDRNASTLSRELLSRVDARSVLMPVTATDVHAAAADYQRALLTATGGSGVLDVVHLGLGEDGHTASLVPGDPVLRVDDADVAITKKYQGTDRMTLTYPVLNRARHVIWQVAGATKALAVAGLLAGADLPAAGVERARAEIFLDTGAAGAIRDSDR